MDLLFNVEFACRFIKSKQIFPNSPHQRRRRYRWTEEAKPGVRNKLTEKSDR